MSNANPVFRVTKAQVYHSPAEEHLCKAIDHLKAISVDRCRGTDQLEPDAIRKAFHDLLTVRDHAIAANGWDQDSE